jgi:hypothetical protein
LSNLRLANHVRAVEMRTQLLRKKTGQEAQLPDLFIFIDCSRSSIGASWNRYASFLLHVLQRTRRRTTFPHFGQRAVDRAL